MLKHLAEGNYFDDRGVVMGMDRIIKVGWNGDGHGSEAGLRG